MFFNTSVLGHITLRTASCAVIAVLLSSCTSGAPVLQRQFMAMGTMVSITVADAPTPSINTTLANVEREVQQLGREWYAWNPQGELGKLNAALATGQSFTVTPALATLLRRSRALYLASDGAFDPAIAPMVASWGFNDSERSVTAPTDNALQAWSTSHATFADLQLDHDDNNDVVSSTRRDLMLDLGAIGKGYIVDRAIEQLRASGVRNAMVNAGGNLRVIGQHPEHAWRIAIRAPRNEARGNEIKDANAIHSLATVELGSDESVSTSGDYERFAILAGKRVHHLLDPTTGQPALHTIAVTVFASDAALADAASTALFIAGPTHWQTVARKLGVTGVVRVDASGAVQVSRALQSRLHVSERTAAITWVDL